MISKVLSSLNQSALQSLLFSLDDQYFTNLNAVLYAVSGTWYFSKYNEAYYLLVNIIEVNIYIILWTGVWNTFPNTWCSEC